MSLFFTLTPLYVALIIMALVNVVIFSIRGKVTGVEQFDTLMIFVNIIMVIILIAVALVYWKSKKTDTLSKGLDVASNLLGAFNSAKRS